MRVVVTGADGFVGGHVERALRAAGHDVLGTVFAKEPDEGQIHLDLTDEAQLQKLPEDVEVVVNAAGCVAHGGVPNRVMFAVNTQGPRLLSAWARSRGVGHFIHTSSIAVYGFRLNGEDRTEAGTPRLQSAFGIPYMRSKAQAEAHIEASGVHYTMLRPPAVIGEGDTVISGGMAAALRGDGLPLPLGGSRSRRVSIILVENYADLVCRLVEAGPQDRAFNCADYHLTFEELAGAYAEALDVPVTFRRSTWLAVATHVSDPGFLFLWMSARFGAHYPSDDLQRTLAWQPVHAWRDGVARSVQRLASRSL